MLGKARLAKRDSRFEDRSHVLILRRIEKLLSRVALLTGNVAKKFQQRRYERENYWWTYILGGHHSSWWIGMMVFLDLTRHVSFQTVSPLIRDRCPLEGSIGRTRLRLSHSVPASSKMSEPARIILAGRRRGSGKALRWKTMMPIGNDSVQDIHRDIDSLAVEVIWYIGWIL